MNVQVFALPDLGEGLEEAELVGWLVGVGDAVAVDQPVAEVETAKATVEVPCPFAGTVAELHAEPGGTVAVGAPLIGVAGAPEHGPGAGFGEPGVIVPGADPADPRGSGDGAAPSAAGSGAVLVGYGTGTAPARKRRRRRSPRGGAETTESPSPAPAPAPAVQAPPVVSPLVRRLARENGVDVRALRGTGEGGLVLRRDVAAAIGAAAPSGGRRVPMRGAHKAMAERVTRSRREIPEATVWVDADASGLVELRRRLNTAAPESPVSLLGLVARFCVLGLARYGALNARVDADRGELVHWPHVHLGFAAQTPRGLVVPVVRDAHRMSARELSAALAETAGTARRGSLTPDRTTGGTFTVNNYGVFGVDGSAAVINHPEAAILGMGRITDRPRAVGGAVVVRPVVELTLAFDHRVCDGATAGGFLRFVADCVEDPALLLGDL